MLIGAATMLSGCALVPEGLLPGAGAGAPSDEPLAVHAEEGAWLSAAYAGGVAEPIDVDATLCGFFDGLRIHSVVNAEAVRVEAIDIDTEELVWGVDGVRCSMYSVVGDEVIMFAGSEEEGHVQLGKVSAATGEGDAHHLAEYPDVFTVQAVGAENGVTVLHLQNQWMEHHLLALDETGEEVWAHGPLSFASCLLLERFVGCETDESAAITVIETATGRVSLDAHPITASVTWARDGYLVPDTPEDPEHPTAAHFDFDGASLGTVGYGLSAAPDVASADVNPVLFSVADHARSEVLAVAPDGAPLVLQGDEAPVLADGTGLDSRQPPESISADGAVMLRHGGVLQGPDHLVTRDGELLGEIDGEFIEVAYGYVVVRAIGTDEQYRFYAPTA